MNIYEYADTIVSKEEFVNFLKVLLNDYSDKPKEWGNRDMESYLSGMWGYAMSMENNLKVKEGEEIEPTWRVFAKILLAASVYE
jgi:hypothetical protein